MTSIQNHSNQSISAYIQASLALNPHLAKHPNLPLLYLKERNPQLIPILSGGGSGHEPAHMGYIGDGMLTGALYGSFFTPPKQADILEAIRFLDQGQGVFIIIKNFPADLLEFRGAIQAARKEGHQVAYVLSHDDISIENKQKYQIRGRGLAGTILLHKILGHAAQTGASLEDLEKLGLQVSSQIATIGFASKTSTLFVAKLGMGVSGVAWATIIAQAVSAVLCFIRMAKLTDIFDLKLHYMKYNKKFSGKIIKLGLPSGLTQAIFSMAMIVVQSLTNSFGEMFISANVIVMRVDGFAMLPNFSFGSAMTTYAGQNVGARKHDRVIQGAKQGTLVAVLTTAALTALILIFGKPLMGIFTNTTELVDLSRDMMGIIAAGYVAMAVTQSLSGVMRGAGDTMTPMWISLFTTVIVRVPVAYGIAWLTRSAELPNGRQECIFISLLCSWLIGALVTTVFYMRGRWKKKAQAFQ